jgi:hypothetical protein
MQRGFPSTLENHVDVHFREGQIRYLRRDDLRQVILQTTQETVLEIRYRNRSNHILFKLSALLAAQRRSIRCFRIVGERVTERLELLFQTIEALQRDDQLPIGPTATHHKIRHPADGLIETQNVVKQKRSEYGKECPSVICGLLNCHNRFP